MRPAWRLAIKTLSERRSRTALLISTVALCAMLIAAVTSALASMNEGISHRVGVTVGYADVRLQHVGKRLFSLDEQKRFESLPGVELVVPRAQDSLLIANPGKDLDFSPTAYGVVPEHEQRIRPRELQEGRLVERVGEVVIDRTSARTLDASLGDLLTVKRYGDPVTLKVVGIISTQLLGGLARPEVYVTLDQLGQINEWSGKARELDVLLTKGTDPQRFVDEHAGKFDKSLILRTTQKITSGLDQSMQASQIGMSLISSLAFLAASFIIMTGMTTGVTERQRELAVLRCIGGTRFQLAESQLVIGAIVGLLGAIIGVPAGVAGAAILITAFPEQVPAGFVFSPLGVALSFGGAVGAGLAGGVWPAILAARTSPLAALAARSRSPRLRGIVLCAIFGVAGALIHIAVITLNRDPFYLLYGDAFVGIPALLAGYFLLAVPVTLAVAWVLGPVLSRLFALPPRLLRRSVQATPYRHGFTAAAMMVGLALLVAIWTNGRAVLNDWLGTLKFPDAFVFGRNLTPETQRTLEKIPGVTRTCAITLQHMSPRGLWDIANFRKNETSFIAFEPESFFDMAELVFDEGNAQEAKRRLLQGNAVMVAREYKVAKGIGVGSTIDLEYEGKTHTFDVVAVVNSPGLDIVNSFFDIGEDYLQQSVSAVFGSRQDLIDKFGNDAINLIQMELANDASDEAIIKQSQRVRGVITVGSAKSIKNEITKFLSGSMLVFSIIGICSMLVACFGVANLIVAAIQMRQFEFGVLRAIGAQRGLVARLVLGEAVIIAGGACVVGTLMGTQGAWAGQHVNGVLMGIELKGWTPPLDATAAGWACVLFITLAASGPAVWRLARRQPRELLGAMKG